MHHRIAFHVRALAVAVLVPGAALAQALSFAEAQKLALKNAPTVSAQEATLRAAREGAIGAGQLADPKLIAGLENVPVDGADRWSLTKDGMTMRKLGFMQEFVLPQKLRLRETRADAEVRKEEAVLAVTQANLRRDAALAWIDVWAAERQLAALRSLESEAALNVSAAQAALAGGKGTAAEPFAARWSATQLTDRMIEARRAIARARAQLGRWIGEAATRTLGDAPDFTRFGHAHSDLVADVGIHPHVAMYTPMQQMAQADVGLAEAARHPDWSLEVTYGARAPELSNMLSVMVRVDLPIFEGKRQDPAIRAKLAAAEQVRAQAEDARRAHLAEVQSWIADWQAAIERMHRIDRDQLPLVKSRREAALAAYAGGKGDLAPVLEARRAEIETRLAEVDAAAEAARAWAQLNTLLPEAPAGDHP